MGMLMFLAPLARPPTDTLLALTGLCCLITSLFLLAYVCYRVYPLLRDRVTLSSPSPPPESELTSAVLGRLRLDLVMISPPYRIIEGDNFEVKLSTSPHPYDTQVWVNDEDVSHLLSDTDLGTITSKAEHLTALKETRDRLLASKMLSHEVRDGQRPSRSKTRNGFFLVRPPESNTN